MKELKLNHGVWPVALTPFQADGRIDFDGYRSLLDYYEESGSAGIFAVCLSSELYQLEPEERLQLARATVRHLNGRLPVVACAGFGDTPAAKAESIRAMNDTGVDAVVLPASLIVGPDASEMEFRDAVLDLLARTGEIAFGVYECPVPYHRLISPARLGELARLGGGRLAFIKDTCCDAEVIREKLAACAGSSLKLYNANLRTCLASLRAGAAGYSGTSANFYLPQLTELCRTFDLDPARADRLQLLFNVVQRHVEYKYPRAAKLYLKLAGVRIGDYCRVGCAEFNREEHEILESMYVFMQNWNLENRLTDAKGDTEDEKERSFHPDRAAGSDRDYRHSGRHAVAGTRKSQGKSPADRLR